MMDLARRRGIELKAEDLSRELGVPVVETIAVRKQGIDRLTELLSDPSAWSSWVPEATEEDDLARLNRILRKLGLDKIFPDEFSDRIDRVVLNPWLGVTILMIILFFVFQAVFAWSAYPMEWIEEGFNMLGELCAEHLPDGFVKDLLVDAVIGGVGGVVVFLPQILILGDTIIERTSFEMKGVSGMTRTASGTMHVNGRVRGYINGVVDAEIKGVLHGQFNASIATGTELTVDEPDMYLPEDSVTTSDESPNDDKPADSTEGGDAE